MKTSNNLVWEQLTWPEAPALLVVDVTVTAAVNGVVVGMVFKLVKENMTKLASQMRNLIFYLLNHFWEHQDNHQF